MNLTLDSLDVRVRAICVEVFRRLVAWFLITPIFIVLCPAVAAAEQLKPETVQKWNDYIQKINAQNQKNLAAGQRFLWSDGVQGQTARLRQGEIIVAPAGPHIPVSVPDGLIHDWIAGTFIPNVTIQDVLSVVRDYGKYKTFYRPHVVESKFLGTAGLEDRFSMLLVDKSVVSRSALDGDYHSTYVRLNDRQWYSVTTATRIQEVADYGTSSQHTLPENQGSGYVWKEMSLSRFEERDGGVYVELEGIALSRSIPFALRWLVNPIVRRVSRSVLAASLQETKAAVLSSTKRISARQGILHREATPVF